jgi:hypothetical protein
MANQIVGRLLKVLPLESGQGKSGKEWKKLPIVLETEGQYPKKVCVTAWGDLADKMRGLKIGTLVTANIDIESREYNDKFYTEVKVFSYTADSNGIGSQPSSNSAEDLDSSLPF